MEAEIFRFSQEDANQMGPKEIIGTLQDIIGHAMALNHDRNPDRQQNVMEFLERAHDLCIKARGRWKA